MQNKEDLDLNAFFSTMKAIDENKEVPPFRTLPKKSISKKIIWATIGIAASLVLAFSIFPNKSIEDELYQDTVIIKLLELENGEQELHIETASSIDIWESPTNELLDLETP